MQPLDTSSGNKNTTRWAPPIDGGSVEGIGIMDVNRFNLTLDNDECDTDTDM